MLSAKGIVGVIYVIIALLATGLATVQSNANVQWFSAVNNLVLHIDQVDFRLAGQPLNYSYLVVRATISNPTPYNVPLFGANYVTFVNSTSEPFSWTYKSCLDCPLGTSSEVSSGNRGLQGSIPANGSLNVTSTFPVFADLVASPYPLQAFLNRHNQTDLTTFVGLTFYLSSAYGRYNIEYCRELPTNSPAICPEPRATSSGGPFGGG